MQPETLHHINQAAQQVSRKIKTISPNHLNISDYNKRYLQSYINNIDYYLIQYSQLLINTISTLHKPISESTLLDYGGGCGILSIFAHELGFKTIIYNDIYDVSTKDAQVITSSLGASVNWFITGDIQHVNEFLNEKDSSVDVICSFDVLEHIYHWEDWFRIARQIKGKPAIISKTSANSANPFIRHQLKQVHKKDEYHNRNKTWGWKERDSNQSFLSIRQQIISNYAPTLSRTDIEKLALKSRGLIKADIEQLVAIYQQTGQITYQSNHPTNTCDPYTGNWSENLIDTKTIKTVLNQLQYDVTITNGFYSYSSNRIKNKVQHLLNFIISLSGKQSLFLSPSYTVTAQHRSIR